MTIYCLASCGHSILILNQRVVVQKSKAALNFAAGKGGGWKETQRKKEIILAKVLISNALNSIKEEN